VNIDPASVKWVNGDTSSLLQWLAAGKVDAIAQYIVATPSVDKAAKCTGCALALPYSDSIADPYGGVLITTTGMIKNSPGVVRNFVKALMQGLLASMDDTATAGQILHQANPQSDAGAAAAELNLMKGYVTSVNSSQPIGSMDKDRVARGIASLQGSGLFASGEDPNALCDFTMIPHITV
jgi:NitT/TauT family transport system substrate-binding protein